MKKYIKVLKCTPWSVRVHRRYNPKYEEANSDLLCECGHTYYRHYDGYEEDSSVHCKYCGCADFIPYNEVYSEEGLKEFSDYLLTLNIEQVTIDITGNHDECKLLEILMHLRRGYARHYLYSFNEDQISECINWLTNHNISAKKEAAPEIKCRFRRGRISKKPNSVNLSYIQHPPEILKDGVGW